MTNDAGDPPILGSQIWRNEERLSVDRSFRSVKVETREEGKIVAMENESGRVEDEMEHGETTDFSDQRMSDDVFVGVLKFER